MDLKSGIAIDDIDDGGLLAGEVGDEKVVLVRHGQERTHTGALPRRALHDKASVQGRHAILESA